MPREDAPRAVPGWGHAAAIMLAALTFLMILVGGSVTTSRAGDSDPTWSFKFWEWFPRWNAAVGGLQWELGHRVLGTIIGFVTIGMLVVLAKTEPRRSVRRFGWVILVLVVVQGVLGGLRVLVRSGDVPAVQDTILAATGGGTHVAPRALALAMIHGTLAQCTFGCMVAMVLATSAAWMDGVPAQLSARAAGTRRLAVAVLGMLVVQLVLGTYARHARNILMAPNTVSALVHGGWGVAAFAAMGLLARRLSAWHYDIFPARQPAALMVFLSGLQILLGIASWLLTREHDAVAAPVSLVGLVRTGHVANGAMILAIAVVVTMRAFRLIRDEAAAGTAA